MPDRDIGMIITIVLDALWTPDTLQDTRDYSFRARNPLSHRNNREKYEAITNATLRVAATRPWLTIWSATRSIMSIEILEISKL